MEPFLLRHLAVEGHIDRLVDAARCAEPFMCPIREPEVHRPSPSKKTHEIGFFYTLVSANQLFGGPV